MLLQKFGIPIGINRESGFLVKEILSTLLQLRTGLNGRHLCLFRKGQKSQQRKSNRHNLFGNRLQETSAFTGCFQIWWFEILEYVFSIDQALLL